VDGIAKKVKRMIRGTTPTLRFSIPFDADLLEEAYATLSQNDKVVVERSLKDFKVDGRTLSVTLTQEETLKLQCEVKTEIQMRVKTKTGEALASDVYVTDTGRILKDGVI
jgi:hypothetical protein